MAEDLMSEKAILKRAVQELHQKLEATEKGRAAAEEHQRAVEEKLTEGAITTVEHVIGMIKSHQPDFDVGLILRGYKCSQVDDAQKILESVQPTA
jgi:hypothetical protein